MMEPADELPPELRDVSDLLSARPRVEPRADLRRRVLADVQAELARPRGGWWRFAAGLAACLLVGLNLAMSSAGVTDFGLERRVDGAEVAAAAEQIRRLVPEITAREARRQAVLMTATRLPRTPPVRPLHRRRMLQGDR